MKKKILSLSVSFLVLGMLLIPGNVNAEVVKTNFKETVEEEITLFKDAEGAEEYLKPLQEINFDNYKESEDKINVYIFRGSSCGYCLKAVSYFASIVDEYGKYFNLITYEVWSNADNAALLQKVADVFDEEVGGVPYIVIGDKTFPGYAKSMNTEIQEQIVKEYNSKEKYDVMDHLDDVKEENNSGTSTNNAGLIMIAVEIAVGFVAVILVIINAKNKIIDLFEEKKQVEEIVEEPKKNKSNKTLKKGDK